ncbi:MAG TPA: ribonuclease HII [Firmicutes bacterium]|nr:ribonuclease HII [Bacillota bacterium]
MSQIERKLHLLGYRTIAGVDEAGRGPLAGPVVAAAVVMPPGITIPGVDDSKKLSSLARERAYELILQSAKAVGIGIVSHILIDRMNILRASYLAMRKAVEKLGIPVDYVMVDGYPIPGLKYPQQGVIHGDATCFCIACASIIAKVTRDRIMVKADRIFPGYGFAAHKGYPTPQHLEAIARLGPSPIHRRSFGPVKALASHIIIS